MGNPEPMETRPSDGSAGLRVNDMILCVNGKVVGGMTETGLSIELDVCGPQLVIVVSRYKHGPNARKHVAEEESNAWRAGDESMNAGRLQDWTEIGAVEEDASREVQLVAKAPERLNREEASVSRKGIATSVDQAPDKVHETLKGFKPFSSDETSQASLDDEATSCCSVAPVNRKQPTNTAHQTQETDGNGSTEEEGDGWEEDDDPWLGCVCGEIHPSPIPVFWIQCDVCDAWYSVSKDCIGFDKKEVENIDSWSCWACSRNNADEHKSFKNGSARDTIEGGQEEHTLSEYELLRLRNIARNNARLESLGLLDKQFGSVESRRTRVARNEEVGMPMARRRSTRIQTPALGKASSAPPEGNEGVNSLSGVARVGTSPQAHACEDLSEDCGVTPVGQNEKMTLDGCDKFDLLKPGTIVSVAARTWPGSNKLGGIGKVLKVHISQDDEVLYDVRYVLGGKESDVEAKYVTRHEFGYVATSSSIGTQS